MSGLRATAHSVVEPSVTAKWVAAVLVIFYAVVTMIPLFWIFATGLKTPPDSISYPPKVVFAPSLEGYCNLFTTRTRQTPEYIRNLPPSAGRCDEITRSRNMVIAGPSNYVPRFVNSLVIAFGAMASNIVDQQVNMAVAEFKGEGNADAIAAFLAQLIVYLSLIGFVIQVTVTSRIHRVLGIGFALLMLPVSMGAAATLILLNRALWAPSVGRVIDTSIRYTIDKTSREVLFLPLPADLKYRAKPFVDVTMDRLAKGVGAVMMLVCIKDWGLGLDWQQLSYVSLVLVALWVVVAIAAKREYMRSFRRSIEQQIVEPTQLRFTNPDPSSVETLVTELAHPDPKRALYAIDLLDAMDKQHLVTPLLLAHDSAEIRARAIRIAESAGPELADRWLPGVERALKDRDSAVRIAAVSALASLRGGAAADVMRPFITGNDPALAIVAAAALAGSSAEADLKIAEDTLRRYSADTRGGSTGSSAIWIARARIG